MSQISGTAPMPGAVNLLKYFLSLCERFLFSFFKYLFSGDIQKLFFYLPFELDTIFSSDPNIARQYSAKQVNELYLRYKEERREDCMVDGGELVWSWSESPVRMSQPSMWVIVRSSVPVSLVNR